MEVTTTNLSNRIFQDENIYNLSTDDSDGLIKKNSKPQINNEGKEAILLYYRTIQKTHREEKEPSYILSDFITDGGIKKRQEKYKDSRNFVKKSKSNINGKTMNSFNPRGNFPLTINASEECSNKKNKTFTGLFSQPKTQLNEYKDSIVKNENNYNYQAIHTPNNIDYDQSLHFKRMKEYIVPMPKKKIYCLTDGNMNEQNSINRKDKEKEKNKEDESTKTEKKQRRIEELTEKNKIIAMHNIQIQLENEQSKKLALELEKKIDILTQNNIDIDSDVKEIEEEPNEFNSEKKRNKNFDDSLNAKKQENEEEGDNNNNQKSFKEYEEQGVCSNENISNNKDNQIIKNIQKNKKEIIKDDSSLKASISSTQGRENSSNNTCKQKTHLQSKQYLIEIYKNMPSKARYPTTERIITSNNNTNIENQPNSFRLSSQNNKNILKKQTDINTKVKPTLIYDEQYNLIVKQNKKPLKSEEEFHVIINENIRKNKELKTKQEEDQQKKNYLIYEELKSLVLKKKKVQKKPFKHNKKTKNDYFQGRKSHIKQTSSLSTQIDQNEYLNTIQTINTIINQPYCLTENLDEPISKEEYDKFLNENEAKTKQGNIGITKEYNDRIKSLMKRIKKGRKKEVIVEDNPSNSNNGNHKNINEDIDLLNGNLHEKVKKTIEKTNEILSKENLSNLLDENQNPKRKSEEKEEFKEKKDINGFENSIIDDNEENKSYYFDSPNIKNSKDSFCKNGNETFGKQDSNKSDKIRQQSNEEIKPIITSNEANLKEKNNEINNENRLKSFSNLLSEKYCKANKRNAYNLIYRYIQRKSLFHIILKINDGFKLQMKKRFSQYHTIISKSKSKEKLQEKNNLINNLNYTINNVFIKPIKSTILQKLFDYAYNEDILNNAEEEKSETRLKNYESLMKSNEDKQINQKEEGQNQTYLYESFEDKKSLLLYPNSAESDRLHRICELIKNQRESMNNDSSHSDSLNANYHNRTQQSASYKDLSILSCSQLSIGAYSSRSLTEIMKMRTKKVFKKYLNEIITPSNELKTLTQGLTSLDEKSQSHQRISNNPINKTSSIERKESNEIDISADKDITSNIDWEYNLTNRGSSKETDKYTSNKGLKDPLILEELHENDSNSNTHNRELSLEKKINMVEIHKKEEIHHLQYNNSNLSEQNYSDAKYDDLDNKEFSQNRDDENNQMKDSPNNRKKDDLFVFILEEDGKTNSNIFIEGTETITQGLIRNNKNINIVNKNEHKKGNNRYDYDDRQIEENKEKQIETTAVNERALSQSDYLLLNKINDKQVDLLVNELVASLIEKEMLDLNKSLLPKKRTLSKKEQEIQISRSNSFGSSPSSPRGKSTLREDDFTSSQLMTSYGNSALMRTISDIKKEVCLSIYKTKIAPLLINQISLEIKKNYHMIYKCISQPIIKNAEILMIGMQLKDDNIISQSQGEVPPHTPYISKDFLKEFDSINMRKRNEENVIKDNYFDYMLNESLVDTANEIIENERHYGEVGIPLPWSIRSREVEFKYKNDEFSCQKLQNLVTKKLTAYISFKMGLISENYDHFDVDQLNQDREKKFLRSITEELHQEEPIWKGLEKEETEVKLILNRVIMEQLLNEVVEILEHVQLSRREPSIYQYKSIYSCEDIPRLSFQNNNYNENLSATQNILGDTVNQ